MLKMRYILLLMVYELYMVSMWLLVTNDFLTDQSNELLNQEIVPIYSNKSTWDKHDMIKGQ